MDQVVTKIVRKTSYGKYGDIRNDIFLQQIGMHQTSSVLKKKLLMP